MGFSKSIIAACLFSTTVFAADRIPTSCSDYTSKWWEFHELMITQMVGNPPLIEHNVYSCFTTIDACAEAQGKLKGPVNVGLVGAGNIGVWKQYSTCVETK